MFAKVKPEISLELKIGKVGAKPTAVPEFMAAALRKVSVSQKYEGFSGFSLDFEAERYAVDGEPKEYPLLAKDLLDPFCRVQIEVQIDDTKTVLMDGFITQQDLSASAEGGSTVSVRGEDLSVKMDLFDVKAEYDKSGQGKKNSEIAKEILGKYSSLDVTPKVVAPDKEPQPNRQGEQQSTDRAELVRLAKDSACIFYIAAPASPGGKSTAYWGPPEPPGSPQKALTINMGPANNCTQVSASYNGRAPTITYGEYLEVAQGSGDKIEVKKIEIGSPSKTDLLGYSKNSPIASDMKPLASKPEDFTKNLKKLSVKGTLFKIGKNTGDDFERAKFQAQAVTDRSVEEVVTVNGTLDTALYKAVLKVRGAVDLRGVGDRYDGTYLVKSVNHSLSFDPSKWSYTQGFNLVRGGTGTTISAVTKK